MKSLSDMNRYFQYLLGLGLLALLPLLDSMAEERFLTASCTAPFPEAMSHLQELIIKQGFTISRVQHVDKGLRSRGYETGLYRVVFFARPDDISTIMEQHPELIPYIPLNTTIFEDGDKTGISSIDPLSLHKLYKNSELEEMFKFWSSSMKAIFTQYSRCEF